MDSSLTLDYLSSCLYIILYIEYIPFKMVSVCKMQGYYNTMFNSLNFQVSMTFMNAIGGPVYTMFFAGMVLPWFKGKV